MARHGFAPPAPMPSEPGVCRWCRGRLTALTDDGPAVYCPSGCARNDQPLYVSDCDDCGRPFQTGKRWETVCHECDQRETRAVTDSHRSVGHTYNFSRYGRGRHRS